MTGMGSAQSVVCGPARRRGAALDQPRLKLGAVAIVHLRACGCRGGGGREGDWRERREERRGSAVEGRGGTRSQTLAHLALVFVVLILRVCVLALQPRLGALGAQVVAALRGIGRAVGSHVEGIGRAVVRAYEVNEARWSRAWAAGERRRCETCEQWKKWSHECTRSIRLQPSQRTAVCGPYVSGGAPLCRIIWWVWLHVGTSPSSSSSSSCVGCWLLAAPLACAAASAVVGKFASAAAASCSLSSQ